MTTTRKANCSKWFLASAILVLAGCRSFALPKPPVKDVAVEREKRKAVAVEQFEQRRQKAELTAAKAASRRGDWASCQSILEGVLRRVPQHRDARLLLARTHLEQGRQPAAMAQIETAVGDFPEDPKVHETVAGLLREMGKDEEAWAHMDRARHLAARAGIVLESDKSLPQREGPVATADYLEGVNQPPGGNRIPDSLSDDAAGIEQAGCSDDSDHVRLLVLLDRFEEAVKDGETAQAWDLAREAAGINPNDPSIPTSLAVAAAPTWP
jgi:Flp pilus assembly protein TadD